MKNKNTNLKHEFHELAKICIEAVIAGNEAISLYFIKDTKFTNEYNKNILRLCVPFAPLRETRNPPKIIHSNLLKAKFSILAGTKSFYAVFTAGNFRFVSRRRQLFICKKYYADQAQYFAGQR
jgi:hypothetical protein